MADGVPIGRAAGLTGVSVDTLRYYEAEGLIPPVGRGPNGHRRFTPDDIAWVEYVTCLRRAGLGIAAIRTYATLYREGEGTLRERVALLAQHRDAIRSTVAELTRHLEDVERKLRIYRRRLRGS